MAASQIGDLGDFIRSFPQFTYDDYLYRLSMAQVLFLTVDSSHIKYLRGKDKEIWEKFWKRRKSDRSELQAPKRSVLDTIPKIK